MDRMTQQTETHDVKLESNVAKRIVGAVFGVIEVILGLRLLFELLGANPENGFVKVVYNSTQFFVGIFEGIFARTTITNEAVFEPATLIAIVLVALTGWFVLNLMSSHSTNRVERTEHSRPVISDNQQNPNRNQEYVNQQNPNGNQGYVNQQNPNGNQGYVDQQNPNANQQNKV